MVPIEAEMRAQMVAALAGDAVAYRLLLDALSRHLRRYFLRRLGADRSADADDLVQETLIAVHSRRATYQTDKPFTVWLHAIARYRLIDHFRRNGRRPTVPIDDVEGLFAADESDAAAARMDVGRLLESVPAPTRALIRQVKIEGQSIADVAAGAGMSETAVKVGVHRGLKKIAERIRNEGGGDER